MEPQGRGERRSYDIEREDFARMSPMKEMKGSKGMNWLAWKDSQMDNIESFERIHRILSQILSRGASDD